MKITIPKILKDHNKPTNFFWVVDLSGSMWSSITDLKDTLRTVKDLVQPGDTFSLAYFSSAGDYNWICKGASVGAGLNKLIDEKIYSRGLTCFTEVLSTLADTVNDVQTMSGNDDNVLFFLTDGHPNDRSPAHEVLNQASSLKGIFTHAQIVGYSGYYNRKLLIEMSENIGGSFAHVSSFKEMTKTCDDFMSSKKSMKVVELTKCYDIIWQVTGSDVFSLKCEDKTVKVLETDSDGELFGIDFDELSSLPVEVLSDARFIFSLAFALSQKNKANLGVWVMREAGAFAQARSLQKAFTVSQKGNAENELKRLAVSGGVISRSESPVRDTLSKFLETIEKQLGDVSINLLSSPYKSITRKGNDVSKVSFHTTDNSAKITDIIGNEDRANISLQTVRQGEITIINDDDLRNRVEQFNTTTIGKQITLPIKCNTYRNYTLVSNGDFNFETLVLDYEGGSYQINPSTDLDIFDEDQTGVHITDFVNLYKVLIEAKAHASVLAYYIKTYSAKKHQDDIRVAKYGTEGALLLEEMGLDYAMRYAPKKEYTPVDKTGDFIPFLEITAALKGSATINAKVSYEKYLKSGKQNPGDLITWPLFEEYDKKRNTLGDDTFVEFCQATIKGQESLVRSLKSKISAMKFFLMITNAWFYGVDKSDEFEHDGLLIKVNEVNEYL